MAKQRILENPANVSRREYIVTEFNEGKQRREDISASLGFANSRAMYNALVTEGWITQSKRDGNESAQRETTTTPRTKKVNGVLPREIEEWVKRGLVAQHVRDGGDEDDFVCPEITPEFFMNHRPVRDETEAFVVKAMGRIGGFDSEAGRALRAWVGRPLTKEQEIQEQRTAQAEQARKDELKQVVLDRAVLVNVVKASERASSAFRSALFGFIYDQFGDELFDRMVGSEILP